MSDDQEEFMDKIKNMNMDEMTALHVAYLSFSSKFIEYIREIDPVLFKRALDYGSTVSDSAITEN